MKAAPAIKPGTRCECRDPKCPGFNGSHGAVFIATKKADTQCVDHAVRLVTVPDEQAEDAAIAWLNEAQADYNRKDRTGTKAEVDAATKAVHEARNRQVALCDACARWHEEKATATAIHAIHGMPGEPEPGGAEVNAYVYIQSEKAGSDHGQTWGDLWTVGFYDPKGDWHPESDHKSAESAAARVAWLNGGHEVKP